MAGGAAQSITIADLSNVIHFVIDAASKASAESQMKKMQQEASKNNQVPIKPQVDSDAADKALITLQSLKSKATALLGFIGISVGFAQFRQRSSTASTTPSIMPPKGWTIKRKSSRRYYRPQTTARQPMETLQPIRSNLNSRTKICSP